MQKIVRNFQRYGAEVKGLLEQRYPSEIEKIKEEIEKNLKPEVEIRSPNASEIVSRRVR